MALPVGQSLHLPRRGDGSIWTPDRAALAGTNASRISSLLAGRTPHFAYDIPQDPVTNREVTVTSAAQFNTEAQIAGSRITIASSLTGNLTINASDIDVVMSNALFVNGGLTIGSSGRPARIRWTGGNQLGDLYTINFTDLLFDDFFNNCGRSYNYIGLGNAIRRLAMINTTISNEGWARESVGNWAFFTLQGANPDVGMILGNFKVIGDGLHAFRIQKCEKLMIFDAACNPTGEAMSGLRLHEGCSEVWIRDSWVRGNMHINNLGSNPLPHLTNAIFDNLDRYEDNGSFCFDGPTAFPNSGEVRNSRVYSSAGAGGGTFSIAGFVDGGGNDRVAWDGATVPDYSSVGAIR